MHVHLSDEPTLMRIAGLQISANDGTIWAYCNGCTYVTDFQLVSHFYMQEYMM